MHNSQEITKNLGLRSEVLLFDQNLILMDDLHFKNERSTASDARHSIFIR